MMICETRERDVVAASRATQNWTLAFKETGHAWPVSMASFDGQFPDLGKTCHDGQNSWPVFRNMASFCETLPVLPCGHGQFCQTPKLAMETWPVPWPVLHRNWPWPTSCKTGHVANGQFDGQFRCCVSWRTPRQRSCGMAQICCVLCMIKQCCAPHTWEPL